MPKFQPASLFIPIVSLFLADLQLHCLCALAWLKSCKFSPSSNGKFIWFVNSFLARTHAHVHSGIYRRYCEALGGIYLFSALYCLCSGSCLCRSQLGLHV